MGVYLVNAFCMVLMANKSESILEEKRINHTPWCQWDSGRQTP